MIVMEYASDGDLLSYLGQNIDRLTWRMKLEHLRDIANRLNVIHMMNLIHCDLHSGNIILSKKDNDHSSKPFICDLGLSKPVDSFEPNSVIHGVLPYIAPEVFDTRRFSQKSDIYAFGIIAHLIASGRPPFRDRIFDEDLIGEIHNGLRPMMPDSAPVPYRKLAETCCDADANKRPTARELYENINNLIKELDKDERGDSNWNAIYNSRDIKPLSRAEKEGKYTSRLLPERWSSESGPSNISGMSYPFFCSGDNSYWFN
jgi:serine/threonine protein kinase